MILILFILIVFIICGKYIHEMHEFNHNASLIHLQNPNYLSIQELLNHKSPLIIHNLSGKFNKLLNVSIDTIIEQNPGYIINDNKKYISLNTFKDETFQQMFVLNNRNMIQDFSFENPLNELSKPFLNKISCNLNHNLSILKGKHNLELSQNKHNNLLFVQLFGTTTFYIFNPKHKNDIIQKPNSDIKKWAIKIILKPDIVLYLPPEWYYFYETNNSILNMTEWDNYFTYAYNYLR